MKAFGHMRPVRDEANKIVDYKSSPARALTRSNLGHNHGPDRGRQLVVSLVAGDLIEFRPYGTRRTIAVPAIQAYEWALRSLANLETLKKARASKERRAIRLAQQRQARAERRLFKPSKKGQV